MEFKKEFQKLMADMENNMSNEEDLKYVQKNIITELLDMLQQIDATCIENKNRISKLEKKIEKMSKELYINDVYDIEIVCPYCNYEFETEFDENKKEIKCPECNNIIELDWFCENEENSCGGGCSTCEGCKPHDHNDLEDDM